VDPSRVPVDRLNNASEDRRKGLIPKRTVEIGNREVVGHPELPYVGENDLYAPASVLMRPRG
jgi:hypothetical protein